MRAGDIVRDRATRHVRAASRNVRNIGEIPQPADTRRRKRCSRDLLRFCKTYFPQRFGLPFSADHLEVIQLMQRVALDGESFALAMPRGSGKTTLCECLTLFGLLNAHHSYVVLFAANKPLAEQLLESIKVELEYNDLLNADFPETCMAIRALEGAAIRCRGQLHADKSTRIGWHADEINLPCVKVDEWKTKAARSLLADDGTARTSGATLQCYGIEAGFRGLNKTLPNGRKIRPTLAIVDDPQTEESAYSDSQTHKRLEIIQSAIKLLSGPGHRCSIVVPCTVKRRGDLPDQLLDRQLHPEFNGLRFSMLKSLPDNLQRWEDQYRQLMADGMREGKGIARATRYYQKHRKAMQQGAEVAWPARFDAGRGEIDGIQHAMNFYLEDRTGFACECQNQPLDLAEESDDLLSARQIIDCTNNYDRGVVPPGHNLLVGFVDVQADLLYWALCAFSQDYTGAVIDYGSWPRQPKRYFSLNTARETLSKYYRSAGLHGRVFSGLERLIDSKDGIFGGVWRSQDGSATPIRRVGIDCGYLKPVIFKFCMQSLHRSSLIPCVGTYIGARHSPLTSQPRRPREIRGDWWIERPDDAYKWPRLTVDSNEAKTLLHSKLAQAEGDPGSLRLYGCEDGTRVHASHHKLIADHLTAETPVRTAGRDRELTEWIHRVEKPDNHWFDCLAGCVTLANTLGASNQKLAVPRRQVTQPRKRRKAAYL